jgi:hypothetical protein
VTYLSGGFYQSRSRDSLNEPGAVDVGTYWVLQ